MLIACAETVCIGEGHGWWIGDAGCCSEYITTEIFLAAVANTTVLYSASINFQLMQLLFKILFIAIVCLFLHFAQVTNKWQIDPAY